MNTLLKDMPEFAERIENNYLLGETIKDNLNDLELDETSLDSRFKTSFIDAVIKELKSAEFELDGNEIKIGNRGELAENIFDALIGNLQGGNIQVNNAGSIAESIRESLTEFVNQNYTFKGV